MNERIKDLYNQCFVELKNDVPNVGFDFEKFAEMIIKECAEVAGCNGHVSGFTLGDLIKEHFGVEE